MLQPCSMIGMLTYVVQKIGRAVFVVWAAFTVTFVLLYVLPADPVDLLFDPSETNTITPEARERIADTYGFNDPLIVQYLDRLGHALTLDFGTSVQSGKPVLQAIGEVLPSTILLAVLALAVACVLALVLATTVAVTHRVWLRRLLSSLPSASVSLPVFLIGVVVIQVFSFQLGWFPSFGAGSGPQYLVLPVLTLAMPVSGPIAQLLIGSFDREYHAGYVVTAKAKGATRFWAVAHEVAKNASLPALTIAGITFGNIVTGAVIVETIFSRAGLGRLTQVAVSTLDVPLVQGIVVFVAAVFALINLIVDILYPQLDPRLKGEITGPPQTGARTRRFRRTPAGSTEPAVKAGVN
jgi:peptide/nickel transport system permease protein